MSGTLWEFLIAHSDNTQSQHFRPKKNTSIVMTLNHFLFCTVISVWGFQLSKRYHCVNRRSARWHLSGKAGSTDWAQAYGEGHICPLADSLRVVCKSPRADAGLGDGQRWRTGSWHTNIPVSGDPPAAVGSRAGSGGGGVPYGVWCTAGGVRVVLLWTEACRWLFIPVNQRHYGDLRIFLVSLQIIMIMAALF